MQKSIRVGFLVFVVNFFSSANAFAILLEPHASLLLGDADWTQKTSEATYEHDGIAMGFELGGKVGYEFLLLMGGLELAYSHQNVQHLRKSADSSILGERSTYQNTMNRTLAGLFVGVKLPILLKVWGSYYFHAANKLNHARQKSQNPFSKDDKLSGKGYGLGVGFTSIPFVDLFAQVRLFEYDKWRHEGNTTSLPNYDSPKYRVQEVLVGVSLPL